MRPRCREYWAKFGNVLKRGKVEHPSTIEYGVWLKESGLTLPPANNRQVRADAIWMAENWAELSRAYVGQNHYPSHVRQDCREAGFEWAGALQRETADPVRTAKRKARKAANDEEVEVLQPPPQPKVKPKKETIKQKHERMALEFKALPESKQKQFGRLLWEYEQIVREEIGKELWEQYQKDLPDRLRKLEEKAKRKEEMYYNMLHGKGLDKVINKDDMRVLRSCLHPDKFGSLPETERAKYTRAMEIINRIAEAFDL
jgi:hypothetical protein